MTLNTEIEQFFKLACDAIRSENEFLSEKLLQGEQEHGFYRDYHHGISALVEATLVFLVVRKLLAADFPMEVRWEDASPGGQQGVDLVLADKDRNMVAIEFKFWKMDDASDLLADSRRLASLSPSKYVRRLVFAIWREAEAPTASLRWLDEQGLKAIAHDTFSTHFRSARGRTDWICTLALLEPNRILLSARFGHEFVLDG